jgi:hypothetical protein
MQCVLPYLCITFRGATQLANPYFGALFLQSHYLMGPCCGTHLSSLLQAISSEPYSLLHFTADTLYVALFLRHHYTDTLLTLWASLLPYFRDTLSLGMAFCHHSQGIHY